jgi:DNA-binding NtrC family response regulator
MQEVAVNAPNGLKCCFIDDRTEFFQALSQKIGSDILLVPIETGNHQLLRECDVIIVGLSNANEARPHSSLSVLNDVLRHAGSTPVITFLPTTDRQLMRAAISAGAYDSFIETGSMEELRMVLRRAAQFRELTLEIERLKCSTWNISDFSSMIGADPKMRAVFTLASKVASTDATALITGESGTGKELLARAIHRSSQRSREPFVAIACSSLPESLIESELFGHEKGAFTGAAAIRKGRFEAAERGTIFLDEISELSPNMQLKLLRVLQERSFERLGSNFPRPMLARVICATNQPLDQLVKTGRFRLDLYYRMNTIELTLPPLRERRDDVILLAHSFLHKFAEKHRRPALRICAAAMSALAEHDWPGNVRELQNVIEGAVVICDGPDIRIEHLPARFMSAEPELTCHTFEDEVRSFKRRLIQRTLEETHNNKLQAARSLGIARSSLHRLIDELQIERVSVVNIEDGRRAVSSRPSNSEDGYAARFDA